MDGTYYASSIESYFVISNGRVSEYERYGKGHTMRSSVAKFDEQHCILALDPIVQDRGKVFVYEDGYVYWVFIEMKDDTSFSTSEKRYSKLEKISKNTDALLSPYIGMSADDLEKSTWGQPYSINKTTTTSGVLEQWVYKGNRYVYIEDDIVISIQE